MTEPLDLGLKIAGPDVKPAEIDAVCGHLRGRGWLKMSEIEQALKIHDRKMRAIAEHSDGRILSGQSGYCLFDKTTPLEDADRAAGWLEAQGRKMLLRGAAIRRRYHRYARDRATA